MDATPNPSLNPGGFIGAACGALAGGVFAFTVLDPREGMNVGLGVVGGLIVCAMGGNLLWDWVASKFRKP